MDAAAQTKTFCLRPERAYAECGSPIQLITESSSGRPGGLLFGACMPSVAQPRLFSIRFNHSIRSLHDISVMPPDAIQLDLNKPSHSHSTSDMSQYRKASLFIPSFFCSPSFSTPCGLQPRTKISSSLGMTYYKQRTN